MTAPIELYFWPTPNGFKISIALEELGLPYVVKPVNIGRGEQFSAAFLAISPNNKMPAIIDPDGPDGKPISIFESGAILQYLARKTGKLYGRDERGRVEIDQWLHWQIGGLGPISGQAGHFRNYAPRLVEDQSRLTYGQERYTNEVNRLYGVLDKRLEGRDYVADDYSIADIAIWPWLRGYKSYGQSLEDFPNLNAYYGRVRARPAVERGLAVGADLNNKPLTEQTKEELAESAKALFGQSARSVAEASAKT